MNHNSLSTTVVIPVHNRERFIATAIESVLSQTHPAIEIVVVDDGSTDGTVGVVHKYGNRVRLIEIENNGSGPSRPRNIGIEAATSEFITLLDSDDYFEPHLLECHADLLDLCPDISLVGGNYQRYWSDRGEFRQNVAKWIADCEKETLMPNRFRVRSANAYTALCQGNFLVSCTGATFRKSLWHDIGRFDESLSTSNDYDFFFRVLRRYDLGYIDEPLFVYVFHEANISAANLKREFRPHQYNNLLFVLQRELRNASDRDDRNSLRASIASLEIALAWEYCNTGAYASAMATYWRAYCSGPCRFKAVLGMMKIPIRAMRRSLNAQSNASV